MQRGFLADNDLTADKVLFNSNVLKILEEMGLSFTKAASYK